MAPPSLSKIRSSAAAPSATVTKPTLAQLVIRAEVDDALVVRAAARERAGRDRTAVHDECCRSLSRWPLSCRIPELLIVTV
jgi:hypothetical protein